MPSIRTILAATDLTARSAAVPLRAAQLARALGARLVLAAVTSDLSLGGDRFRLALRRPSLAEAQSQLATLAASIDGVAVSVIARQGPVSATLAALVGEVGADLVILGLHKERAVLDSLRLTTMEQVTLAVPCPVLVAHKPVSGPYARVLGAVTFAPASAHAMAIAARLAPDAEFHAIHALSLSARERRLGDALRDSPAMTEAEMLRTAFLAMPGLPPALHRPEIIPGGVHEVIAYRVDELQPDLLVIGSASGRNPAALGNYARDLMRAPPTDLLIAKPI